MYEIGQQVVCVKTHSQGVVKEGQIYPLKGMRIGCCGQLLLDIGITPLYEYNVCGECRKSYKNTDAWWLSAELFRPLDDLYNTEIEELMNEVNERQPFEI